MKRIGIDARLYFKTGLGVYLRNMLYYLQHDTLLNDIHLYVYVMEEDFPQVVMDHPHITVVAVPWRWHTLGEQIGFCLRLYQDDLDLMHFTYFGYPILYVRPFIATIHDITPLTHATGRASQKPKLYYLFKYHVFRGVLWMQFHLARLVIVPTLFTRDALSSLFGSSKKMVRVPDGLDRTFIDIVDHHREKVIDIPYPYVLYVGNMYPHKNIQRLIDVYNRLKDPPHLVLAGPDDFFFKRLKREIAQRILGNRIHMVVFPSDEEKVWLYKNAIGLVHPSLSEGFGLPLLEAAYCGTPVVASNLSVFQEILDKKYLMFDPTDIDDMTKVLQKFIDATDRSQYVPRVDDEYSFANTAKGTIAVYRKVLGL